MKMNKYKLTYVCPKTGRSYEMQITANNYQDARKKARKEFRQEHLYAIDRCENWELYRV